MTEQTPRDLYVQLGEIRARTQALLEEAVSVDTRSFDIGVQLESISKELCRTTPTQTLAQSDIQEHSTSQGDSTAPKAVHSTCEKSDTNMNTVDQQMLQEDITDLKAQTKKLIAQGEANNTLLTDIQDQVRQILRILRQTGPSS